MSGYPLLCLLVGKKWKAGDPPPSGYLDWHEWAGVQHRAGLRQLRCADCGKLRFPQERCCKGGSDVAR